MRATLNAGAHDPAHTGRRRTAAAALAAAPDCDTRTVPSDTRALRRKLGQAGRLRVQYPQTAADGIVSAADTLHAQERRVHAVVAKRGYVGVALGGGQQSQN